MSSNPATVLPTHLCADGLVHSEDWPPSPSWETECFISRETDCMCSFAAHESTCSVKSENFTLKCCKHHKHCKHFKVKPQLPLSLSLWHITPEVLCKHTLRRKCTILSQRWLMKFYKYCCWNPWQLCKSSLLKEDAVGFSVYLFDFYLPLHEQPLTTHH